MAIFSLLTITLAAWGWITIKSEREFLISQIERRAQAISRIIILSNTEAMLSQDYPVVQTNVKRVGEKDPEVAAISIFRNGETVAQYKAPEVPLNADGLLKKRDKMAFEDYNLGEVEVVFSTKDALALVRSRSITLVATVVLLFAVLSFLIAFILNKLIVARVSRLSRFARRIGEGSFEEHLDLKSLNSEDEMGDLANAMNQMVNDLTVAQKRHIEQELLKKEMKIRRDFFANVSHELKTPMTLVLSSLENLLKKTPGDFSKVMVPRETFEAVRHNTHRLSGLISDLLDLTRSEIGKTRINPIDIQNTQEYFMCIFRSIIPLMERKELQHELIMAEHLGPHYLDKAKIDKVVVNLLSNAIKFTPIGGKITMLVWDQKENGDALPILHLSVRDRGIGIPKDNLSTVFERFVQVDNSSTRAYEGMGIGLSLVKEFVEQHGGSAFVTSEVGQGSTFTITLPRKEHVKVTAAEIPEEGLIPEQRLDSLLASLSGELEKWQENEEERDEVHAPKAGEKIVLVVEDNVEIRATIKEILSSDYQIITAKNGRAGLDKAREVRPSIIVSDIMMPVMDGYQMIKEIRKEDRFKDLPIILLTAKSGEEGLAEGFESGANDYLTKPFSSSELMLRVKNHLERQELKAELVRQQNLASVGTLSAGISHNMNTYSGSIDIGVSLAKSRLVKLGLPEKEIAGILQGLESIKRGNDSIRHMIQSLEMYSQKNKEGFKDYDLVASTHSVLDIVKTKLPAHIQVEFSAPKQLLCYYNPHLLNPALLNLLTNAIHACEVREKGIVDVIVSNGDEQSALITITDNGPGIPIDIQRRVWDPYFTTKDIGKGSGLGLWMVRRAVETDHKGKVWFETGERGTSFYVRLPKQEGHHGDGKEENSLN